MAKELKDEPENATLYHAIATAALSITTIVTKSYSLFGPLSIFGAGVTARSAYKDMNKTDTNTQGSTNTDNTEHDTSKNHQETNKNDEKPSWTGTLSTQNEAKTDANSSVSPRELTQVDSKLDATKAEPNTNNQ